MLQKINTLPALRGVDVLKIKIDDESRIVETVTVTASYRCLRNLEPSRRV